MCNAHLFNRITRIAIPSLLVLVVAPSFSQIQIGGLCQAKDCLFGQYQRPLIIGISSVYAKYVKWSLVGYLTAQQTILTPSITPLQITALPIFAVDFSGQRTSTRNV
jgi:hypothetical protein